MHVQINMHVYVCIPLHSGTSGVGNGHVNININVYVYGNPPKNREIVLETLRTPLLLDF